MAQPTLSVIDGNKDNYNTAVNSNSVANSVQQQYVIDNLPNDKQSLLELSNRLHSYIEVDRLMQVFSDEVKSLLDLDDVIYHMPEQKREIKNRGRHFVSYQLVFNNQSMGELFFIRKVRFQESENQFIEKLLISLLSPLYNALKYHEMVQAAQLDPLTGALNRLGMDKNFEREIELAKRNNDPLSLLVLDVDHFKQVNDKYGHAFGDQVLKDLAQHVKDCIRSTDVFARFGGEEFIVLLNNTNRSGALLLAERIRQQIENTASVSNDKKINYTASIGVTTLENKDNKENFFKRADNALYQAKNNGRNRVVLG